MKLHEREGISGFGWRMAVPGGWLYDNGCAAFGFVPDPTAEHVTHGAGGAAATANYGAAVGYSKAIADCLEILTRPRASYSDCVEKIGSLHFLTARSG